MPEEGGGLTHGTAAPGTAPRDGDGGHSHHPKKVSSSRKCVLALVPSYPRNQRCWWGEEKLLENSSHAFFYSQQGEFSNSSPGFTSNLLPQEQVIGQMEIVSSGPGGGF